MNKYLLISILCIPLYSFPQSTHWDSKIINSVYNAQHAKQYQTYSNSAYFIPISITLLETARYIETKDSNTLKNITHSIISTGSNVIITYILKRTVDRDRPSVSLGLISPYHATNHSMPSGHTSISFNAATNVLMYYKKWYYVVPAYTWACSVGYSRIRIGAHYPTDVVAGALLGIGSSIGSYYMNNWLQQKTRYQSRLQP